MEALDSDIINAEPVLTSLRAQLQTFAISPDVYLSRSQTNSQNNQPEPSLTTRKVKTQGIHEGVLPKILQLLGIRSMILNSRHDLVPLATISVDIPKSASKQYQWQYMKSSDLIQELQSLFQNCRIIAFTDWSKLAAASDLWTGLLTDVIKPIGKQDLEFIFYLGDPQKKRSFQVDEILDIISDFSYYGQVTFALDEGEAIKLWMVLNGVHWETPVTVQSYRDLKRKYVSIFQAMNIARLLIYSANKAVLLTKLEQFALARKQVAPTIEMATDARLHFIKGFSIGLLHQLDMPRCLALGLIVFGSYGERRASPDKKDLIGYINRWIDDLQKSETLPHYH
ncbi:hypothetical protein G8759_15095 [Spirosoma aureum]|uniref:Uncharacterized protein n=1 Tax=Spirosoma aureum TaxID=2692134 RepID=A0A6G9AMX3_9BACT|nr:hypothetical protein [Spirosoma aureum]QIP13842.1 hypothetical protein G8759_15095 [Spirosoma aureum]